MRCSLGSVLVFFRCLFLTGIRIIEKYLKFYQYSKVLFCAVFIAGVVWVGVMSSSVLCLLWCNHSCYCTAANRRQKSHSHHFIKRDPRWSVLLCIIYWETQTKKNLDGSIFGWLFVCQDTDLKHYNGGSWFGGGGIGIRYCIIYLAKKLWRYDCVSC